MSTARAWMVSRLLFWNSLKQQTEILRSQRHISIDEALRTVEHYRDLARDLAGARRLIPGTQILVALETLYIRLHALVCKRPRSGRLGLMSMLRNDIPRVVSELSRQIFWVVLLFILSTVTGWFLVSAYPELISLIASEKMISTVESGKLWTDDLLNVTPSSLLSINILSNNIAVSIFAVCAGCFFGLGTFYIISMNGLMLGGTFAFVHQHGLGKRLFEFIVAHGLVELSVICISGAIGAALGDALIRPIGTSRRDSFEQCMHKVAPLLLLCALLLIGAGIIEGFVSPDATFPLLSRVIIGVSCWLLMVLALTGRLLRRNN